LTVPFSKAGVEDFVFEGFYEECMPCSFGFVRHGWLRHADCILGALHGAI
jgi:hypothetical protein